MIDTKQRARHIFEEYAGCYSEVDIEELAKYLDEIKSEAIKEFWSELKKHSTLDWRVVSTITGDNLAKEMVGEEK